jgi:predicted GNAT superfamily acetyltransferase
LAEDFEVPGGELAKVEIPVDIQLAKEETEEAGARWRFCTRRAFQAYFARGHRVVGFERHAAEGRCAYLLRREETA